MRCRALFLVQAAGLVLAILTGGPVGAQGIGYRSGLQGGYGTPYPGAAYNPYWGSSPSSMNVPSQGTAYPYWDTAPGGGAFGSFSGSLYSRSLGLPYLGPGAAPLAGHYSPSSLLGSDLSLLPGAHYTPVRENAAHIRLRVPAGAEVWFDGEPTKQTGTVRDFTSPPLTPGKRFVYEVRVRWLKDGRPVEQTQRIPVHANDRLDVDFTRPAAEPANSGK